MKKNNCKFPPGTEVIASIEFNNYDDKKIIKYVYDNVKDCILTGIVSDTKSKKVNHVIVNWDPNDYHFDMTEINVNLLTHSSAQSLIEEEFIAVEEQIRLKMEDAAKLIFEAGELSKQINLKSLESFYYATEPLIEAMDQNGWRSSSWNC